MRTSLLAFLLLGACTAGPLGSGTVTKHIDDDDNPERPDGGCDGLNHGAVVGYDIPSGPLQFYGMWGDSTDVVEIAESIDTALYAPPDFNEPVGNAFDQYSAYALGGSDQIAVAFAQAIHEPASYVLFTSTDHWATSTMLPQDAVLTRVTAGGARIFALGPAGLVASDDRGASWRSTSLDFVAATVFATDAEHVFVGGSLADGSQLVVASSIDGGATWTSWTQQVTTRSAVSGLWAEGQAVVASVASVPTASSSGALFASHDGGATFTIDPLAANAGRLLAVHGNGKGVISAVGQSGAVVQSIDGGESFHVLPLEDTAIPYDYSFVHVDQTGTSWAFALTTAGHAAMFEIPQTSATGSVTIALPFASRPR